MPVAMIAACWVSLQLSLAKIKAPLLLRNSRVGSANALGTPVPASEGPMARMSTVFETVPVTMKPPINTLSPVCTTPRVEIFAKPQLGTGVGVGVGVPVAVAVGVPAAVAVAVGVPAAVAVAVGVPAAVAVAVGVAATVAVGVAVAVAVGVGVAAPAGTTADAV